MKSEWPTTKLANIAKLRSGFPFKSSSWQDSGVPVIKIANVKSGRVQLDGCGYVRNELAATVPEWWTKDGDVLIAMTGYVGEVARIRTGERYLINQRVGRFEFKQDPPVTAEFLFYFLQMPEVRALLEEMARGSAQPNLSATDASRIEVPVPPPEVQTAIADLGRVLDDRIDNLRATNDTLEAIAQALFKSWFVDFDPVHAKAEGRAPAGMDAATAALFPSAFEESDLGLIPKGWRVKAVGDVARIVGGKQLTKDDISESGPNPVFGGAGEMGRSDKFNADGLVITVGRVGAYCGRFFWHVGRAWVNNNASHIRTADGVGWWVYWCLRHLDIETIKKGAAQPFVSNSDIAGLPIAVPDEQLMANFHSRCSPLHERIAANLKRSATLTSLRDTLLPRLISGKLRLPESALSTTSEFS